MSQLLYALSAKLFHVERSHHRSENHRSPHRRFVELVLAGKIAHKTSGKCVSGASGIKNRLERVGGDCKITVVGEQCGAVFATLYDQSLRTPRKYCAGGLDEIRDFRQLSRFRIVYDYDVYSLNRAEQRLRCRFNPEIHGIQGHQLSVRDLFAHASLQVRLYITQKNQPRAFRRLRKFWLEIGKDIQLSIERVRNV